MLTGALSHISPNPAKVNADNFKTESFDPDGVDDLVFQLPDDCQQILSVFIGGLRAREGEQYQKDDNAKTVTYLGVAADLAGIGVDVDYFSSNAEEGFFGNEFGEEFD